MLTILQTGAMSGAQAALYIVGTGTGCSNSSIQEATNAAASNPGPDEVRVTRSQSYLHQAVYITSSEQLDVIGGFATCTQAATDNLYTTVDGSGGSTDPVFTITVNTGGLVRLRHLTIRGGDEDGSGYGGGIYFRGNGILEINDSTISQNTGGYGGGIYAEGTARAAELVLGNNVQVTSNTARYSGGGVYVDGLEMTMTAPGSRIAYNHAPGVFNTQSGQYIGGYGGGLMVLSSALPAYAYVGSSAVIGDSVPIYFNDARYGGGVSIIAHEGDAELQLFTVDPSKPVSIRSNNAAVSGGAIFQRRDGDGLPISVLWYAFLEDNGAPRGAAATLAGGNNAFMRFNQERPAGAADCPVGIPCGGIISNYAQSDTGQATGAAIEVGGFCFTRFSRMIFSGNQGKNLFRGVGAQFGGLGLATNHVLMVDNDVTEQLIATDSDDWDDEPSGFFEIRDTTIVGNAIGASAVLRISNVADDVSRIERSIIWQPGKTTLQLAGHPLEYLTNIVSEVVSLNAGPEAIVTEPRFVDAARSDYSLRAGSPAIDAATSVPNDNRDTYNRPRDVDLDIVDNSRGARDIGAIERQSISPMVLNGDFDVDSNLWSETMPATSSRDETLNASGPSGSASIKVALSTTLPSITGLTQCVHLPGAAIYALNGWGRTAATSGPTRDSAYLKWEYRRSGGEACTDGPPDASGQLFLSQGGWRRAALPALISVTAADWTYTSSISVTFAVFENGITSPPTTNGWFDGITLDVLQDDRIFFNGFDPL